MDSNKVVRTMVVKKPNGQPVINRNVSNISTTAPTQIGTLRQGMFKSKSDFSMPAGQGIGIRKLKKIIVSSSCLQ